MQKNYLKYLESASKKFAGEKNLFDIVLFGSAIKDKENPSDIDIAIVFINEKLDNRLNIAQEFKKIIKSQVDKIHITAINIVDLFKKSMLARQGIIAEGYSLVDNAPFANKLGFYGYVIFTYNLKNLDHNKKTRFTYALIGRENKEGIIKLTGARVLGKGAIAVPSEKSNLFLNFLERWNINFTERKAIIEI